MAIRLFNTTGYRKMSKDEFWDRYDKKDDYVLDAFGYCEQDLDGDVWVPEVSKLFELIDEDFELRLKAEES